MVGGVGADFRKATCGGRFGLGLGAVRPGFQIPDLQ